MKQINLSLAKSGDVAVLRNGERREIVDIILHDFQSISNTTHLIRFALYGVMSYSGKGKYKALNSNLDILDILRDGVSIFETKINDKP